MTILVLDVIEGKDEVLEAGVQFVKELSGFGEAVVTDEVEVEALLPSDLEEEVAQVLHHVLVDILQG